MLSSSVGAIEVLVGAGANVDLQSPKCGLTSLHWAVVENNTAAVEALIKNGASVASETFWGTTALDMALEKSGTPKAILTALTKEGAKPGSKGGASPCRSSDEEEN